MRRLKPFRPKLRILAGEGNYNLYGLLAAGRLWFVFAKCLLVTASYLTGRPDSSAGDTIVLLKGGNQKRYLSYVAPCLKAEFGLFMTLSAGPAIAGVKGFPRISIWDAAAQVVPLTLMLLTGRRRYLNIYLLEFDRAIRKAIQTTEMHRVRNVVCFNDQPYDVAAIVQAFNEMPNCRTIVIQHGLILNEKFYFPSVAREFWAWGDLSKRFFRAWNRGAKMIVKGRYQEDLQFKALLPVLPIPGSALKVLVAPSFHHGEVKEIIRCLQGVVPAEARLSIKFHPATKLRWILALWCRRAAPSISIERAAMEEAVAAYDVLVTKNSTSAVDFLLRGKPVAFLSPSSDPEFPSKNYGLQISALSSLEDMQQEMVEKNEGRLAFIRESLNV